MSFFKEDITKEEWENKYKKIAERYDAIQDPYQQQQPNITLTGEQLKKIALASREASGKKEHEETPPSEDKTNMTKK